MMHPFQIDTTHTLVARCGSRNGYIQLSTVRPSNTYNNLPLSLFEAAHGWAVVLESLGAPRVYWITLSEVVTQLHIHLYPRWIEDTQRGVPLFEARDTLPQPVWILETNQALKQWAERFDVALPDVDMI